MTLIPFNGFQKLLRLWESTCPQNGAQAMLVDGVLDPDVVESAWQSTLRDMGLGRIHVEEDEGYSHEIWSGNPPAPLVSHLTSDVPIHTYLQEQMDRRFMAAPTMPYRAFALQQGERCYFGIIYQHWVADSVSIRLLMREWFLRIFFPAKARRKLIDLPRLRDLRGPELKLAPRAMTGAIRHCYGWWRQRKQLASLPAGAGERGTSLHSFSLAPSELDDLLLVTRAEGCSLNDLLIAALTTAIEPHLGNAGSSTSLALATSIDLRPYCAGDLSETFGFLLAYAPVTLRLRRENMLDAAQDVARQTRQLKDSEQIAQYLLLPRLLAKFASRREPDEVTNFFRRHAPISATLANVNLNKSWLALYHPGPVLAYFRATSPSPAIPLAVTTTTLGETFDVIISIHKGAIAEDAAGELANAFASTLRSLVQSRPAH